jgi:hypothetical protein
MNVSDKTDTRDLAADDPDHRRGGWEGIPLITRAAGMAISIIAVAEEKGVIDAMRLFLV